MTIPRYHTLLNLALAAATISVMGTGLILFTQFHIGSGSCATDWGGASKVVWRNIHRIASAFFMVLLMCHLYGHVNLIRRLFTRFSHRHGQRFLLLLFCAVSVTGFIAWWGLPSSSGSLRHARHACVDLHNFTGLSFLVGVFQHIWRRWRFF